MWSGYINSVSENVNWLVDDLIKCENVMNLIFC